MGIYKTPHKHQIMLEEFNLNGTVRDRLKVLAETITGKFPNGCSQASNSNDPNPKNSMKTNWALQKQKRASIPTEIGENGDRILGFGRFYLQQR